MIITVVRGIVELSTQGPLVIAMVTHEATKADNVSSVEK